MKRLSLVLLICLCVETVEAVWFLTLLTRGHMHVTINFCPKEGP